MTAQYNTLIRDMPQSERPRERLELYGADTLGDADLLAILLRTGNRSVSVIQLAQHILGHFGSLRNLANASVQELSQVPGIGLAKACQLKAAFTLGKRLATSADRYRQIIQSPADAVELVMEELRYETVEHFQVIFLDTRHQIITRDKTISTGSLNASIVHPREVFKKAISHSAAAIILIHNHPSGDPTPSSEDLALTARMVQTGELVGIGVLDHLIIGDGTFISLKDRGLM
ncbi:MAG: RadC family protein [Armatimonadota bacterium]